MISPAAFLAMQWNSYPGTHRTRINLWLHIVFVPLFLVGNLLLVGGLATQTWTPVVAGTAATITSIALQGHGHRHEAVAPEPFTGTGNAMARILAEQWVTFPRFLLSGGWRRALRATR